MSSLVPSGQETIAARIAPHPAVPPNAPAVCGQARADAYVLAQSRANAVIIGDQFTLLSVLGIVWPSLKKSVWWVNAAKLSLPVEPCGTLILEGGHLLSERDQTVLLEWLHGDGQSTRLLTTSSRPLFPLVQAGSFLASLYYRLNHVLVEAR